MKDGLFRTVPVVSPFAPVGVTANDRWRSRMKEPPHGTGGSFRGREADRRGMVRAPERVRPPTRTIPQIAFQPLDRVPCSNFFSLRFWTAVQTNVLRKGEPNPTLPPGDWMTGFLERGIAFPDGLRCADRRMEESGLFKPSTVQV